jgi:dTDP-4-dehydrorhamnose 3,5-epimerase-like enzyme
MMEYKIEHFQKFNDKRGQLVVFLKNRDLENKLKEFGQIYFVTFEKKGVIRGNHYHKKIREWFGVVNGRVEVTLVDVKTGEKKQMILDGDSKKYVRLEIGPNIAHGFKSISSVVTLLNYTDKEWSGEDVIPMEVVK